MKSHAGCQKFILSIVVSTGVMTSGISAWADDQVRTVEVRSGTVAFDAATNVGAISVHGKSAALEGRAKVRLAGASLSLENLEATLPVKSIDTGMSLRDNHMRKYVFTTTEGTLPDLRFTADKAVCEGTESQSTCQVAGDLTVRGVPRPFTLALKITRDGMSIRAVGDGIVKLSAYGIPPPSQLGVRTEDAVKLHLDFTARPAGASLAAGGAQ